MQNKFAINHYKPILHFYFKYNQYPIGEFISLKMIFSLNYHFMYKIKVNPEDINI
jgi:hypothetical protein